jgi:hypothetical protein
VNFDVLSFEIKRDILIFYFSNSKEVNNIFIKFKRVYPNIFYISNSKELLYKKGVEFIEE